MTVYSPAELHAKLSGSPHKLHYRTTFQGLPISIENRVGSKRKWGPKPSQFTKMKLPYGYIRGAEGYDGDEVDVFIGPSKKSEFVFIVNQRQLRSLGKFDEHKVMLGFDSMAAAKKGYLDHYNDIGPKLLGSIRMWTMKRFKAWLESARATDGPVRKSLAEALAADLDLLIKAGPFVGPRGGLWADARHTVAWKADYRNTERNEARIEALGRQIKWALDEGKSTNYFVTALEEDHGVTVHHEMKSEPKSEPKPLRKVLFHSAPAHVMASIQSEGLKPREGEGLFEHGSYAAHAQGKVFLSDNFSAAKQWHGKVEDMLFHHHDDDSKHDAVMLRVKHRRTARDKVGDPDVSGSRQTKKTVPPEHLEYHDKDRGWRPVSAWSAKRHSIPESAEHAHALKKSFHIMLSKAQRSPPGFTLIPGGRKGGYRKKKGKGWVYWYPSTETKSGPKKPSFEWGESKWTEAELTKGDFDKNPAHWQPHHARKGAAQIGGRAGGVAFDSKHPVKEAGLPHRLYQVVSPPGSDGWAVLRDVSTGEEREVAADRVMPVFHQVPTKGEREKQKRDDEQQSVWKPPRGKSEPNPTKTSKSARRIPAFADSKAEKGTGLYAMESGRFLRHTEQVYETDASGNPKGPINREKTHVDDDTKEKLIAEFGQMLSRVALDAKKNFGLKSRYSVELGKRRIDETLVELRMSAVEGMLIAMERYEGDGPFAMTARKYAAGHVAIQAAREFSGGIALPKRLQRMLTGFIAARVRASQITTREPTPKEIARAWDLQKWQLHTGISKDDPQYTEPVPMRPYKLKVKKRVTAGEGKQRKVTIATDTKEQVGKLAWAKRMHSFVTGQMTAQGSDFFDESASVFPAVSTGVGLSPREKVDVRASIEKVLPELRQHTITLVTGRQSSTYRTNSGAIVMKKLGLEGDLEEASDRAIADTVTIERKTAKGWYKLGARQKEALIGVFMERALSTLRDRLSGAGKEDVSRLVGIAQKRLVPEEHARPGLTYRHLLEARSREVTKEQVAGWRKKERGRLRRIRDRMRARAAEMEQGPDRDHQLDLVAAPVAALKRIDRMGRREVALRIAHSRSSETSAAIRRMQLSTVEVDHQSPGYEYGWMVTTMTDPTTGRQRRVRARTMRREQGTLAGQPLRKSDEPVDEGVLHDMLRWPRLTALLWGRESIPTVERYQLEALVGLH